MRAQNVLLAVTLMQFGVMFCSWICQHYKIQLWIVITFHHPSFVVTLTRCFISYRGFGVGDILWKIIFTLPDPCVRVCCNAWLCNAYILVVQQVTCSQLCAICDKCFRMFQYISQFGILSHLITKHHNNIVAQKDRAYQTIVMNLIY